MIRRLMMLLVLLPLLGCQADKIADLGKQNKELAATVASLSKIQHQANLELQERCTKQAQIVFQRSGWQGHSLAGHQNHYQQKMGKCFVEISDTQANPIPSHLVFVDDAFEGKEYGYYSWFNPKHQKYSEVKPFSCIVTLPGGEEKTCESEDEFNDLVKVYMEN